jgi:hypothetical protein
VIDLKVNAACAACNGGWMDELDHDAEDAFLTHAVLGFDVKLSKLRDKETVARWCALVGSLMDQATRAPSLPQRVRDAIRDGNVPGDMQAWVFRTEPPEDRDVIWGGSRHFTLTAQGRETGLITTHDIYFATFGIKQLVVHLAQPTGPLQPENRLLRDGPQAVVRQLWPPPLTPLIWPPPEALSWEAALAMPDEIARQTTRIERKGPPGPVFRNDP